MNPFTAKVRAVMRREFMQRVRSKWFLVSTLGVPILLVGAVFLVGFFVAASADDTAEETLSIGVLDPTDRVGDILVEELLSDSLLASRARGIQDASVDEARALLPESGYDLYLMLPEDVVEEDAAGETGAARLLALDNVPGGSERIIRNALRRALVRTRLAEAGVEGLDPDYLLRTTPIDVVIFTETGEARSQEVFQGISFFIAFLFYMVLILYGQMIIRSIIEEKASDIVEVMVSSIRPWELMLGKIVGVGAVGLAQIGVWVIVVSLGAVFGLTTAEARLAEAGIDLSALAIPWGTIALAVAFLVLGYLLYAGMFAGAGATISSESDAQQVALPVIMLIIIPFIAIQGVIQSPDAAFAVGMSLFPFFSPLVMTSRLFVTNVPPWQIGASLVLLAAFVLGAAWVAGRIYRVGVLMKGQRANLPEVIRWVRHG